jgi:hypothetical protein
MELDRRDAFGALLADGIHDRSALEIIERDDGFIDAGRMDRYFASFRQWLPPQRRAMRFARGRVLDVWLWGRTGGASSSRSRP